MGFFDDLVGAFTGSSARKDLQAGKEEATRLSNQGLTDAIPDYERAASRFDPFKAYTDAGTASAKRYADATGVNGVEAQRAVQSEYMADPIQNMLMDRVQRANTRAHVANGTNNSGAATQSFTNALLQRWDAYTGQLKTGADMGQTGLQGAAGQAGADQAIGDARISTASQNAGIATGAANATAGTRAAPLNNLLNIASLGVQAYGARAGSRASAPAGGSAAGGYGR